MGFWLHKDPLADAACPVSHSVGDGSRPVEQVRKSACGDQRDQMFRDKGEVMQLGISCPRSIIKCRAAAGGGPHVSLIGP
jgi:hypothetical protein